MDEQQILSQVNEIFTSVLKKPATLSLETTASDVDGWDSLTHIMLIDRIEKHFSIKFKLMEIMKFKNVGDIVACIRKKFPA
jgi:acyl carrier protein